MNENLPVRLSPVPASEPLWIARLTRSCWSIPTADPIRHYTESFFRGEVGKLTANGWEAVYPEQEIAFILGPCAGAFYRTDFVRVFRWPFAAQPEGHDIKWIARGLGAITVWAEKSGSSWLIDDDTWIGGGGPQHHIVDVEDESGGLSLVDGFPGITEPRALSAVTPSDLPAQFKWLGAEGMFCLIEQPPEGFYTPAGPEPLMVGGESMTVGGEEIVL